VTIFVPEALGEAVSNFLMEQGIRGIQEVEEDLKLQGLRAYFQEDGKEKRILHAIRRYLKSLEKIIPKIPHIQIITASVPEQDWGENWKRFFKPVQVTPRFVVKPPWSKVRLRRDQIPIDITPGMAFGTGTHATTMLCIRALEERLKRRGLSVFDVGTGSGILSIVAAKLGAREIWGIDIDGMAVENARENIKKNCVSNLVKIRKGGIGCLQKKFDVVVANIDLKSLRRMRRPLFNHLKNSGFLILSGILRDERDRLRHYFIETGLLKWEKDAEQGDWVCLTFKRKKGS
jgi:ribosomal protein L11 methyltransferase